MAVVSGSGGVYVAEAAGDDPAAQRQNTAERIDAATLKVVASVHVSSPTDLLLVGDDVWVVTSAAVLLDLSASDLQARGSVRIEGHGPARLAFAAGRIWVINGKTDPPGYLLQEFDPALLTPRGVISVEGGGTWAALAGGTRVWLGTLGPAAGSGLLRSVSPDGAVGTPIEIGAPASLVEADGRVWWASADGRVGAIDVATLSSYGSLSAGTGASALTVSEGLVWVATDELVVLQPTL
jgi:hypothetical protein